jgi:hypothetical protein
VPLLSQSPQGEEVTGSDFLSDYLFIQLFRDIDFLNDYRTGSIWLAFSVPLYISNTVRVYEERYFHHSEKPFGLIVFRSTV